MKRKICICLLFTAILSAAVQELARGILVEGFGFPALVCAVAGVLLVCVAAAAASEKVTAWLTEPIVRMGENITHPNEMTAPYKEVEPLFEKLREQERKTRENERMREEFTANVSHELKTPLTTISGYAEMIETGIARPDDVKLFAGKIRADSQRMQSLIGDIIQLGELDSYDYHESFCLVDLLGAAKNAAEYLALNAEKAGVKITVTGERLYVRGGRRLLENMIYNLCDNAIRYNKPGGSVCVHITMKGGKVRLEVSDTGIGIAKDQQSLIFQRFYRVDKSRSRETGGTGLGLAIVKHIAIRHDAQVSVESTVGEGTSIYVDFPAINK